MRAVITVIGKDTVGILSAVANECAKVNVNITDVTQSVLKDMFAMIMLVDISNASVPFSELSDILSKMGNDRGLQVHVMNEEIFDAMHRI